MPKINIKKYSRSNVEANSETEIDNNIKRSRGRPKKANIEPETDNNIIYKIPQQEQEQETDITESISETTLEHIPDIIENNEFSIPDVELNEPFLEELNTENYREPPTQQEKKEKIEIPQVFKDLFAINKDEKNKTFITMKKKYLEMLECLYNNENYNNLPINGQFYDMMENFAKGKFSKVDVAKELQEKFFEEFMKIKLTNQIAFVSERARHSYLIKYIEKRKKNLEKNH